MPGVVGSDGGALVAQLQGLQEVRLGFISTPEEVEGCAQEALGLGEAWSQLGGALGVLASAPVWLPAAEYVRASTRTTPDYGFFLHDPPHLAEAAARVTAAVDATDAGRELLRFPARRSLELRAPGAPAKAESLRALTCR